MRTGPLQCCDGLTGDEDRIEFVLRNCQGWEGYYCTNMGNILNARHSQYYNQFILTYDKIDIIKIALSLREVVSLKSSVI